MKKDVEAAGEEREKSHYHCKSNISLFQESGEGEGEIIYSVLFLLISWDGEQENSCFNSFLLSVQESI